jgi:hypothetical protein
VGASRRGSVARLPARAAARSQVKRKIQASFSLPTTGGLGQSHARFSLRVTIPVVMSHVGDLPIDPEVTQEHQKQECADGNNHPNCCRLRRLNVLGQLAPKTTMTPTMAAAPEGCGRAFCRRPLPSKLLNNLHSERSRFAWWMARFDSAAMTLESSRLGRKQGPKRPAPPCVSPCLKFRLWLVLGVGFGPQPLVDPLLVEGGLEAARSARFGFVSWSRQPRLVTLPERTRLRSSSRNV